MNRGPAPWGVRLSLFSLIFAGHCVFSECLRQLCAPHEAVGAGNVPGSGGAAAAPSAFTPTSALPGLDSHGFSSRDRQGRGGHRGLEALWDPQEDPGLKDHLALLGRRECLYVWGGLGQWGGGGLLSTTGGEGVLPTYVGQLGTEHQDSRAKDSSCRIGVPSPWRTGCVCVGEAVYLTLFLRLSSVGGERAPWPCWA